MKRSIFLDRDGVLIHVKKIRNKPYSVDEISKIKIIKNTKETLNILKKNFLLIMVTNQPNVSRGLVSRSKVIKINNYLKKELKLDDIYCCFHDDNDNCYCRKPKPGMIFQAQKYYNIDLSKSYFVGNSINDYKAAKAAGVKPIIINNLELTKKIKQKKTFANLESFTNSLFKK